MTGIDVHEALATVEDATRRRPLTWWRAWHRGPGRTSQRVALGLLALFRILVILGGNRTGKTELMRAALVAMALGSDHPDAIEFWRSNGVDPAAFPTGPGRVWIIALTSDASLRYHRKHVRKLIPKWGPRHPQSTGAGSPWHAWNLDGKGPARIEVMVPGYDDPAEIYFLTEEPGDDAMQGDSCRAILHDEEGKTAKTWDEADVRLWDQNGWHVMTNTPKSGRTWVYHRFVTPPTTGEALVPHRVYHLHSADNPHIDKSRLRQLMTGDAALVAARTRGEFVVLGDRWWPQFARARHVLPGDTVIPASAVRFRAIDFGTRHPFACLWAAYLRAALTLADGRVIPEGSMVVYREHYRAEWTISQHVDVIRRAEGWVREGEVAGDELDRAGWNNPPVPGWVRARDTGERFEATWVDPEDPQQRVQLNRDHELYVSGAIKSRRAGHDAVAEELQGDDHGPRLFVLESCVHAIDEWERYVRSRHGEHGEGEQADAPVRADDHTCDCVRYLVMGVRAWRGI